MMKFTKLNSTLAVLACIALPVFQSCSKDKAPVAPAPPVVNVQLSSTTQFGNILTDSAGKSLYFFSIDANGTSGCAGNCILTWPVFYSQNLNLATGLQTSDFATITRADGAKQTTYKGWPLYYYAPDAAKGDIKGDAVGSVWFVAKPDYSIMLANTQLVGLDGVQYTNQFTPGTGVTQYITDDYGRTLYAFAPDHFKKNTFTKADLSNNPAWPLDTLSTIKFIPSILDKTKIDTVNLYGKIQLCYKGWPMYHFGADSSRRGNTKGVSVPHPGVWTTANGTTAVAPN